MPSEFIQRWYGRGVSPRIGRPQRHDRTGAMSNTGHPDSLSCFQFGYNWHRNHRMTSIPATDFRKHRKPHHTDRNRKCPLMHQTALSYETAAPDGGRQELKTSQGNARSPSLSLRRSPRTTRAIPAEASESASGLWDDPIDDPGLG
ncbi:MAG: hypothetical protein LAKADJCE_00690 [Candidatus Argoarchaeum ethanivorans]|uniref:Uncharacterized protein n=1 Tax=Candidatus Argoarchaeum ethanivorans TaxID=2608793 RepID=A0A811TFN6_9EURY|nr:MAG: hypothetical protein LAKADJCE_00690 [Candidatus Argoarchaeum ethanivorans]